MVLDTIAFALFSAVLLGSSLGAVMVRDVWHAALLLGVALVSVAALYVTLVAEFLAAIQVLVYVGGVLILITFAVMLTRREIEGAGGTASWRHGRVGASKAESQEVPTNRPQLKLGSHLVPGVVAIGLFAVLAWVFANAGFGEFAGFEEGESVVRSIGFALIDVTDVAIPTEGFLVALIVIALVLDAALDGAIHLARRDEEDVPAGSAGGDD